MITARIRQDGNGDYVISAKDNINFEEKWGTVYICTDMTLYTVMQDMTRWANSMEDEDLLFEIED